MARFRYSALLEDGRLEQGHIEAASRELVIQRLDAVRQHAIEIVPEKAGDHWRGRLPWFRSRRGDAVTLFTRELAWLLRAGMPLSRALEVLARAADPALADALATLRTSVRAGGSLADAMAKCPEFFNREYADLVRMAEMSGTLTAVLERIAETRSAEAKIRQKVQSALLYPLILSFIALSALGIIFGVVLPRLSALFDGQREKLPFSTRALLDFSDFLLGNAPLLGSLAVAMAVAAASILRREHVRLRLQEFALALPLIGPLRKAVMATEFCRTLAMLLGNGISMLSALQMLQQAAVLPASRAMLDAMATSLRKGEDHLAPLESSALFPAVVAKILRVGEETGNIVPALEQLTTMLEQEFQTRTERLLTVLEPAIIVSLSAIVGFIVITVMNGVVSINDLAGAG